MDDNSQLTFNFGGDKPDGKPVAPPVAPSPEPAPAAKPRIPKKNPSSGEAGKIDRARRAVIGWLATQAPCGIGLAVPTRNARFQADVAAFWSKPAKIKGTRTVVPVKTTIVEIRHSRSQCWPDCARKDELLPALREEKERRTKLEERIRATEPELRLDDSLFPDYELWDYSRSVNREYHRSARKIEELERALYNGSRFERIRRAMVADNLYLAVPKDEVHPHELADGWGLLYVNDDMSVEVVKEADRWRCELDNKYRLVQNIAASCLKSLLFAKGVELAASGKAVFRRPPKRRRF